jgi:hypothetical protein
VNFFGIPTEAILTLGSTVLGGYLGLLKTKHELAEANARRQHDALMALAKVSTEAYSVAREAGMHSPGMAWTRRVIALLGVFFIIVWPKIVCVFWPDTAVAVAYFDHVVGGPIPFLSSPGHDGVHWTVMQGLFITPLDTHLIAAVIGLYFGHEIVKRR